MGTNLNDISDIAKVADIISTTIGRDKFLLGKINKKDIEKMNTIFQELPRVWLEMIGIVGLLAVVSIMLYLRREIDEIIPVLGLFALAACKTLPTINRILASLTSIKFSDLTCFLVAFFVVQEAKINAINTGIISLILFDSWYILQGQARQFSLDYQGIHLVKL